MPFPRRAPTDTAPCSSPTPTRERAAAAGNFLADFLGRMSFEHLFLLFETALAAGAGRRNFDGVVCGHIHHAETRRVNGILYLNDGDWVESCTALVEHHDGRVELRDWAAVNKLSFFTPREPAAAEAA